MVNDGSVRIWAMCTADTVPTKTANYTATVVYTCKMTKIFKVVKFCGFHGAEFSCEIFLPRNLSP